MGARVSAPNGSSVASQREELEGKGSGAGLRCYQQAQMRQAGIPKVYRHPDTPQRGLPCGFPGLLCPSLSGTPGKLLAPQPSFPPAFGG